MNWTNPDKKLALQAITELQNSYAALPWYKKLFFSRKLAKAISVNHNFDDLTTLFNVFQTIKEGSWISRRFNCINTFNKKSISTQFRHIPGVTSLTGPSSEKNFEALATHEQPEEASYLLHFLDSRWVLRDLPYEADHAFVLSSSEADQCRHLINSINPFLMQRILHKIYDQNVS